MPPVASQTLYQVNGEGPLDSLPVICADLSIRPPAGNKRCGTPSHDEVPLVTKNIP